MKITIIKNKFGTQVLVLLFAALLLTRLFMEVVELVSFKWDDKNIQDDFNKELYKNCKNLQLSTEEDGSSTYHYV